MHESPDPVVSQFSIDGMIGHLRPNEGPVRAINQRKHPLVAELYGEFQEGPYSLRSTLQ